MSLMRPASQCFRGTIEREADSLQHFGPKTAGCCADLPQFPVGQYLIVSSYLLRFLVSDPIGRLPHRRH